MKEGCFPLRIGTPGGIKTFKSSLGKRAKQSASQPSSTEQPLNTSLTLIDHQSSRQPTRRPSTRTRATTNSTTTTTSSSTSPAALPNTRLRAATHKLREPMVSPRRLAARLRRPLNSKRSVLVRHDVVLVLRVDGLVLRGDIDVVSRQLVAAELLEQVCVAGAVEMDLGIVAVFVLLNKC